jgi:hypothetical protein
VSGDAEVVSVTGGSHGLEASYDAMRVLAATYDASGDRLRGLARGAARAAVDADLLESAVLSPPTAIRAEAAVLAATGGPEGTLVEAAAVELDAVAVRATVVLLETADQAQHAAFESLDRLLVRHAAPALAVGVPLAVAVGGDDVVTDHPEVVEHVVNGAVDEAAVLGGLYPDGHPVVVPLDGVAVAGGQPTSVEELIAHLGDVAALSTGSDSPLNGTIEVQTITAADGSVSHIVNLPGTDDLDTLPWTADDDVRDLGTNLDLTAGVPDDYQQGILEAMAQAGIGPDDPVLVVGHSQGGMEAVAILAGDGGFTVTDVVTAGSPTTHAGDLPAGSNVLSLEQHGDLVPLLDGEPNPPSVEQTTVVVDADPGDGILAHHDYEVYVAAGAAADDSAHPSVVSSVGSLHEHGFLGTGAQVTSQVFQITRAPD